MAMTRRKLEDFPELPGDWRDGIEQYGPTGALVEQAMDWLLRLRERDQTNSAAFERWQDEHPAHGFAVAEARALYAAMATPAKKAARHYHRPTSFRARSRGWAKRAFTRRRAGIAIAACLALFLAMPIARVVSDWSADAVAGTGKSKVVTLADGSRITLNTDTAMDFDVNDRRRHAVLRRGEAWFEIASDRSRPFTVAAGDARVQVVGTKFNVRMDDDQVLVSVTEGRVRTASALHPGTPALLGPGQQALVDHGLVQRQGFDPFEVTAWRKGQIVAYRTPLRTVVRELNRYRPAPIYIVNGALVDNQVTGIFKVDRSDDTIKTLERTLGIESVTVPTGQTFLY